MIRDIMRFNRQAPDLLGTDDTTTTVADYVGASGFGEAFIDEYLVPMGASIWSCPPRTFREFPIRFVVEFFDNHAMLRVNGRPQWRVVTGGSREYVKRLIRPFRDRIRLSTPVHSVRRLPDRVEVVSDEWLLAMVTGPCGLLRTVSSSQRLFFLDPAEGRRWMDTPR